MENKDTNLQSTHGRVQSTVQSINTHTGMIERTFVDALHSYTRLRAEINDRRSAKRARDFHQVRLPVGLVATDARQASTILAAWQRYKHAKIDAQCAQYRHIQVRMHELMVQLDNVDFALVDMETERLDHDSMLSLTQLESILSDRMVVPLLPGLPMHEWPWDTLVRFLTVADPSILNYQISSSGVHHHVLVNVPSSSHRAQLVSAPSEESNGVLTLFKESLVAQNCEPTMVPSLTHFTCKLPKDWQKQLPSGLVRIFETNHAWHRELVDYVPPHDRHRHLRPSGFFDQKRSFIESNHDMVEKKQELSSLRLEYCAIPHEHLFKQTWSALC